MMRLQWKMQRSLHIGSATGQKVQVLIAKMGPRSRAGPRLQDCADPAHENEYLQQPWAAILRELSGC